MTQPILDLDALQARASAYRNSQLSRIDVNCDELLALIDRLRKAEAATVPAAAFDRVMALAESNAERIVELEDRAVPAGWKLVPIEPTGEMVIAARTRGTSATKAEYWAAMIAAAPDSTPTDSAEVKNG
jgi:hypothetical protein